MLIDSHCHLSALTDEVKERVLKQLEATDIIVDSSIDISTAQSACDNAKNYPNVYWQAGFHPFSVNKFSDSTMAEYVKLIDSSEKIVAVGEIGLDETASFSIDEQAQILRKFIELSRIKQLPVVIHNRYESYSILDILSSYFKSYERVVFHCFSHDTAFLDKILRLNGTVSFSLNILRNKQTITDSIIACPLENMLLETDSPYMRIKRKPSRPTDVDQVYAFVANIKGVSIGQVIDQVNKNFRRVFNIKHEG